MAEELLAGEHQAETLPGGLLDLGGVLEGGPTLVEDRILPVEGVDVLLGHGDLPVLRQQRPAGEHKEEQHPDGG